VNPDNVEGWDKLVQLLDSAHFRTLRPRQQWLVKQFKVAVETTLAESGLDMDQVHEAAALIDSEWLRMRS